MLSSRIKKLRGVELACDQLRFEQLRKASNGKQTCPAASLCMKLGNELRPQMRPKKGHGWPGTRHKAGMDSIPARPFLTLLGTCSRKVRGLCCEMGAASGDSRTWTMQLIRAHVYILPRTVLAREISPTLAERGLATKCNPAASPVGASIKAGTWACTLCMECRALYESTLNANRCWQQWIDGQIVILRAARTRQLLVSRTAQKAFSR